MDWHVHAYCLMRNHFHLVIETPQPKVVSQRQTKGTQSEPE